MNEVEKNLIRRLATGNKTDFEIIYKEYFLTLKRIVFRITGNKDDAHDITQMIFERLWINRASFKSVDTDLEAWLRASVRNESLLHLKESKRAQQTNKEYTQQMDTFLFPDMEGDSNKILLDDAINQLPPRQREIVILHKIEGVSHAEIAKELNISKKTSRNMIVRAYENLRQIFKSNNKHLLLEIILWVTLNIMEL